MVVRGSMLRAGLAALAFAAAWVAPSGATAATNLAISPSGSDSNPCTAFLPCATFERAYRLAVPGQIVDVAAGSYAAQVVNLDPSKTSELDVIFRRKPGASASVVVTGFVNVYGRHLEFQNMRFPLGWYARQGADDITFRNVKAGIISIGSARRISVLGGEVGPWTATNSSDPKIAKSTPSSSVPAAVLIDGTLFHDIVRPPGSGLHIECLQIGAGDDIVVRNSYFQNCAVHGLFVQSYGPGYTLRNIRIENNTFGTLEGYHALKIDVPGGVEPCVACAVIGNWASKPIATNVERDGSSITVSGNTSSNADFFSPGWCDHGLYGVVWDSNTFMRAPSCGTNATVLG